MMRRRPRGETTLSKATYDHKRPRRDPPSPDMQKAEREIAASAAAKSRSVNELINEIGIVEYLKRSKK